MFKIALGLTLMSFVSLISVMLAVSIPSPGWAGFWIFIGGFTWLIAWTHGVHTGISKATSENPIQVAVSSVITEILEFMRRNSEAKSE